MNHPERNLAFFALLISALLASGCVPQTHGWASVYKPSQHPKIRVAMPADAPSISQEFLFTTHEAKHIGIDVIGKVGDPVIAVAGGLVTGSYSEPMYGDRVVIDHGPDANGKRAISIYKHLDDRLVSEGTIVARGQQIGTLGTTGLLGGGIPHLHFELFHGAAGQGAVSADPHLFWADGVGRVTCFDPSGVYDFAVFKMTYPVRCRGYRQSQEPEPATGEIATQQADAEIAAVQL
ncbi:M23 family metallopeptidase [Hoeflea ulvae]|uniref:M23 family metallopeptidase n=1 Tax=Hoeflea ulvae TaxID=2983764 RepID=A0ABT3YBS8_9HYPH|nr:M23 family metallopeptidase [Hoeflea ulvae]MCY0093333.1 M23 family metallopeptidase [Hoeflea ulvae]